MKASGNSGITGRSDDLALVVTALRAAGQPFCLIGGLAVNHHVEPVVTLDADFAITAAGGVMQNGGFCPDRFGMPCIPGSAV